MALFLLTLGGMAIVMAIMAVGVMLDGRCLRGSCGGPDVTGPAGESLAGATRPRRETEVGWAATESPQEATISDRTLSKDGCNSVAHPLGR